MSVEIECILMMEFHVVYEFPFATALPYALDFARRKSMRCIEAAWEGSETWALHMAHRQNRKALDWRELQA